MSDEPEREWIVVGGNVLDGFTFFGPFKTEKGARGFAGTDERMPPDDDWMVIELLR